MKLPSDRYSSDEEEVILNFIQPNPLIVDFSGVTSITFQPVLVIVAFTEAVVSSSLLSL